MHLSALLPFYRLAGACQIAVKGIIIALMRSWPRFNGKGLREFKNSQNFAAITHAHGARAVFPLLGSELYEWRGSAILRQL